MKRHLAVLPALLFAFAPCACASKPHAKNPVPRSVSGLDAGNPPLPKGHDVRGEVMGYVVIADAEPMLRELSSPAERDLPLRELQARFAKAVGMDPIVAQVVDLKRPAAVALLNPSLLATGEVRPYVAMLPVRSRLEVENAFVAREVPIEKTPWGFSVMSQKGRIHVGFIDGGYAVVAWRPDLLEAGRKLLQPRLSAAREAPIVVHVNMENLSTSFGPQLKAMAAHFARLQAQGGGANDPYVAYALRGVKNLGRYVGSLTSFELLANLDSGGLTLTARLDGKAEGAWAGFVLQQKAGPSWGTQFLPRDAVLVYTTHASPRGQTEDLDASMAYLTDAVPARRPGPDQMVRLRRALERAMSSTGGDLAYAVWPGRAGGVGLGGAYRVTDPGMAREAVMAVYDQIAAQMGGLVTRSMLLDPSKLAARMTTRTRQTRVGDVETDVIEVSVRWPEGVQAERRVFEAMFGARLTMATAFVGEHALFAVGPDWEERLGAMIDTAQGRPTASMADEPAFAEAKKFKEGSRVSMSYLETGKMARFAAGLLAQASDLDERQRSEMKAVLHQMGGGAIVTTTSAKGRRYEITTHMPYGAILGAARLNGALWRVALSPLINPPMMPPMPVPPPHVTPQVSPPAAAPTM